MDKCSSSITTTMTKNFIYFIKAKATGLVKIGRTRNPAKRLKALQTASPDELEILHVIKEGESGYTEGMLHKRFDTSWVRGEWFQPSKELAAFIDSHEQNDVPKPILGYIRTVEDIAALIRSYRQSEGINQKELADRIGVSRKWIVEVEQGKSGVELGLVMKVIQELNIPLQTVTAPSVSSEERMNIAAEMSKL